MNEKRKPGRPKGTGKNVIRYFTDDELKRFFKVASRAKRDDLLFSLTLYLGLRVGELNKLRLEDFNMESFQVTVRALKGGRTKTTDLPGWLVQKYKRWIKEREKRFYSGNPYLFPSYRYHDSAFSRDGIQRLFKQICKRANINNHSIHDLRHTCAILLIKEGANAVRVRNWLRHRSILSSQVYFELHEDKEFEKEASTVFERYAR